MKDVHLYVGTAVLIFITATSLLWFGKLDANNFVNLTEWTFASVCAGGGISAFRNIGRASSAPSTTTTSGTVVNVGAPTP